MSKSNKKALPVTTVMKAGVLVLSLIEIIAMPENEDKNKAISAYLSTLSERGKAMFEEIHTFAIFAIETAIAGANDFGRMTMIVHAVKAMGNGARHTRLIQWFQENTPATFDQEKGVFNLGKGKTEYNLEYAKEHPYYEKPEKLEQPFSLENALQTFLTLIKRAESVKASPEDQAQLKQVAKMVDSQLVKPLKHMIEQKKAKSETGQDNKEETLETAPSEDVSEAA